MRRSSRPGSAKDDGSAVAVAVDAGKNSQHALKWASEHAIVRGQPFFLVHVRRRLSTIPTPTGEQLSVSEVREEIVSSFLQELDQETKTLLLPYQCFCSRRGLQCREVILDDKDIAKAIVDFTIRMKIDKLVLGAASRTALGRVFKQVDVPTAVSRVAPASCSVYVISKGKLSSVRPASRPPIKSNPNKSDPDLNGPRQPLQTARSAPCAIDMALDSPARSALMGDPQILSRSYNEPYGAFEDPRKMQVQDQENEFMYCQAAHSCPSLNDSFEKPIMNSAPELPGNQRHPSVLSDMNDMLGYLGEMQRSDNSLLSARYSPTSSGSSMYGYISPSKREDTPSIHQMHYGRAHLELNEQTSTELVDSKFKTPPQVLDEALELPSTVHYRRYSVEDIEKATENFSDALKIGEGGYGPVYKAMLNHTPVAIKILRSDITQGMRQFHREVEVLSTIHHPNMVLLLGACPEYGCLVYEYMANGSLEDCLSCSSGAPPLPWQLRVKIAAEIATGLFFLHDAKPEPLVHRDLKPGNILLDHNFSSKIADVGLARLIPQSADLTTQIHVTVAAGTFCYIDPEYQMSGTLCTKSDIYALGVVFLQLLTGRSPMGLALNVGDALEAGTIQDVLDPNTPDWPIKEATEFAELALRCCELRRKDRPDLGTEILPELERLRLLATAGQGPFMFHRQRSHSFKETRGSLAKILETPKARGASYEM